MSIQTRLALKLYQSMWAGLDWVYPPVCGGCEAPGTRWCAHCAAQVARIQGPICPRCGEMQAGSTLCENCRLAPPPFAVLRSWAMFNGALRNAIHRLKYKQDMALADALSRPLIRFFQRLQWQLDLALPAPLSRQRLQERGYNQADLLARPLAWACELTYAPQALQKVRHTRPQVGLRAAERLQNVVGSYQANPALVAGRRVLIIDDVATTGATLSACAAALLEAGAQVVYGLTLARSPFS